MSVSLNGDGPPGASRYVRTSVEERRAREVECVKALHLRMVLDRELEARGIRDPSLAGPMFGLTAREADKLLTRRRWKAGDLALLEAIAARLRPNEPS
jgi:hypothetical protein